MKSEGSNVITKTHDLIEWFLPIISNFPKNQRYTLGKRLEDNLFDIMELLLFSNYQKSKIDKLKCANIKLEMVRHLVRICYRLEIMNIRRYEFVSENINEVGRLVGGWIKQQESQQKNETL